MEVVTICVNPMFRVFEEFQPERLHRIFGLLCDYEQFFNGAAYLYFKCKNNEDEFWKVLRDQHYVPEPCPCLKNY